MTVLLADAAGDSPAASLSPPPLTTVANIKDGGYDPNNPRHRYIGRANRRYRVAESRWHNPYPMQREDERDEVLARFSRYLPQQTRLMAALIAGELDGCTLFCFCAPKRCHGDLLAAVSNALNHPDLEESDPEMCESGYCMESTAA